MADNKNYLEFIDIPDGNGGTVRWYSKDAEAQDSIASITGNVASVAESISAANELT